MTNPITEVASGTIDPPAIPIRVAWEGSYLDHGSLSLVNREITAALETVPGIQLARIGPVAHPAAGLKAWVHKVNAAAPADVQITVRHSWPPLWTVPPSGRWVHIQPWEFGALPKEWLQQVARADAIWAYSEYVRALYVSAGIDSRKVQTVPLGIDPTRFRSDAAPRALPTYKQFRFLFLGGTIHRKGPDVLLAAYLQAFKAHDDVCLVIKDFGGKGAYAGQTIGAAIKSIRDNPAAPEIVYLDEELSPEAIPSLYTACHCLVHPYRGEGFGLPVLEAMACALPVVVTAGGSTDDFATEEFAFRVPSIRRSIGNRVADIELVSDGWLLEPDVDAVASQMRWVFEHPNEARARGRAASQHVRANWTWQRAAEIAAEQLRSLVRPKPNRVSSAATGGAHPIVAKLGELNTARAFLQKGDARAAWDEACAAIGARPFHPEAYVLLSEAALLANDTALARRCAEHALRLAPALASARKLLAQGAKATSSTATFTLDDSTQPPAPASRPRLSICLIARNEERFLGQCLASIRDVADQIVVVDTGSSDRTMDIARDHGAEVYSFTWCDDFGAARNAALEHATGDWVLVLDADEEIPVAHHAALRAHLGEPAVMAWRLPIVDAGNEAAGCSYVPRLFRNAPGVYFAGRVHEHPFGVIEQLRKVWGLDNRLGEAGIVHHGYTKAITASRDKVARNLRLLEIALHESPGNVSLLMSFALELCRSGRLAEGLQRYAEASRILSQEPATQVVPELRETLLTQYASYLFSAGRRADVVEVLKSPLARQAKLTASQSYLLGMALVDQQRYDEAAEQLRQCLARRNQPSLMPALPEIRSSAPRRALALCLHRLKQTAAAETEFRQALVEDPSGAELHNEYARFLNETGRISDALQLLHKLVSAQPDLASVWILGGELALGLPELIEISMDWTSVAIQHFPDNEIIIGQRGEALVLAGEWRAALPLWERLSTKPAPRAHAALIVCQCALHTPITAPSESMRRETDQEFTRWFQRLVAFKAEAAVLQLLTQTDVVSRILPSAGAILKQIASALATSGAKSAPS